MLRKKRTNRNKKYSFPLILLWCFILTKIHTQTQTQSQIRNPFDLSMYRPIDFIIRWKYTVLVHFINDLTCSLYPLFNFNFTYLLILTWFLALIHLPSSKCNVYDQWNCWIPKNSRIYRKTHTDNEDTTKSNNNICGLGDNVATEQQTSDFHLVIHYLN